MVSHDPIIPALRAVELLSVMHQGQDLFLLRDPEGYASEPIVLAPASAALLRYFDGQHRVRDVQTELTQATGQIVPSSQIEDFVAKLDSYLYLESETYRRRRREITRTYAALRQRPPRFAGEAYSDDGEGLLRELDLLYDVAGGPGRPEAPAATRPAALVAPHIDPARGGPTYAHAYRALWGARPERVVVLGVCHSGSREPFILTTKDYQTPLGTARCDRSLVEHLAQSVEGNPLSEEEKHRGEHSIEFQIIFLQHALSQGGTISDAADPTIVPILCALPWQVFLPGPEMQAIAAKVNAFLEALAHILRDDAAGTLWIAGVDLAHVGRRFGDSGTLSDSYLARLRQRDLATLTTLARGDRDGFVREMIEERDERRICGFGALYSLLTLLPAATGDVLDYGQSVDQAADSAVSFAAIRFE